MAKTRKIPLRMCVGCREMKNKRELIRIVRTPEGNVEMDLTGKKAGRGTYICPVMECLDEAIKGKRLQKALEHNIPSEVIETIKQQVEGMNK
ncbi:MAG: YlxR family protein [Syntrophomonadaceae bacterium]|nr:YlxR family protein [Syntrophomonadaceae bacterium]